MNREGKVLIHHQKDSSRTLHVILRLPRWMDKSRKTKGIARDEQ